MKKRLCVAHYNEDLDWLKNIDKGVDIFVYHKKDNNLNYDDKIILNLNNFELRNVGRESHTYLKHIVDNYENLYDLEYFSQGYPLECDFVNVVNNDNILEYKQYTNNQTIYHSNNGYITNHMKSTPEYDTRFVWDTLFNYEPPESIRIKPNAFIKLNKETILMHEKQIYLKCLDFFNDCDVNNRYAWVFEYFWALLFDEHHTTKK